MEPLDALRLRTRRLNRKPVASGRDYVLCWLQQALRSTDNPILDAAVAAGDEHSLPVVVYHGLDNRYPYASHRLHRFILEASQALGEGVEARGLRFCRYVRRDEKLEERLVYRLCSRAALLVTDDMPTFVARWQAARVAARVDIGVLAVDGACLVPMRTIPGPHEETKAFRAAHKGLRDTHLDVDHDLCAAAGRFEGDLGFEPDDLGGHGADELDALISRCGVDMSLPPAPDFRGGRAAAEARLAAALEEALPRYNLDRNNPAVPTSSSKLSPYLHFGVLGPREVTLAVREADVHSAARWKFLDEMLTWREYFHHLARRADDPAAYANVPAWARESLAAHAGDERPEIYPLEALTRAETDDETWNAAQKGFLLDGWMHNNLRMYWVKQLIKWRPTPEDAWAVACELNDRLSLDGRDPSTYGNIQWGFGRSKRASSEAPIYGLVPRRGDTALRRRPGVPEWLAEQAVREALPVAVG